MMIALAAIPDIAVEPVGLPFAPQWLLVALAAGCLGLLARRALAAKRDAAHAADDDDDDKGEEA